MRQLFPSILTWDPLLRIKICPGCDFEQEVTSLDANAPARWQSPADHDTPEMKSHPPQGSDPHFEDHCGSCGHGCQIPYQSFLMQLDDMAHLHDQHCCVSLCRSLRTVPVCYMFVLQWPLLWAQTAILPMDLVHTVSTFLGISTQITSNGMHS